MNNYMLTRYEVYFMDEIYHIKIYIKLTRYMESGSVFTF